MKKFFIEVEEKRAEAVVNLLAEISVKVDKPIEAKKRYVKVEEYGEANFLCLTEEQFNLLRWLSDNDYFCSWEEINPNEIFEEV